MVQTTAKFLEVKQNKKKFIITKLPAKILTKISYAAVRNQSNEDGATQRILNVRRISSIRDFTLAGGDFPSAFILNWVSKDNPLVMDSDTITFDDVTFSAQIIDGQHRIAGLSAAIASNSKFGKLEVPVAIYKNLSTQECADIFISINTEQKTVPKSLVFDLYGIASDRIADSAVIRARDIAMAMNELEDSPYFGLIRLPNSPKRKGGIALSTVINAVKPLVEEKGAFDQVDISELEVQQQIIFNLFKAIQAKYGKHWDENSNAFLYASGFSAALDFLELKLIPFCNTTGSYTQKTISASLALNSDNLIEQDEVKGMSGGDASRKIYDLLVGAFKGKIRSNKEVEV